MYIVSIHRDKHDQMGKRVQLPSGGDPNNMSRAVGLVHTSASTHGGRADVQYPVDADVPYVAFTDAICGTHTPDAFFRIWDTRLGTPPCGM